MEALGDTPHVHHAEGRDGNCGLVTCSGDRSDKTEDQKCDVNNSNGGDADEAEGCSSSTASFDAFDEVLERNTSVLDHESINSGLDELNIDDFDLPDDFDGRNTNGDDIATGDEQCSMSSLSPATFQEPWAQEEKFTKSLPLLGSSVAVLEVPATAPNQSLVPVGFLPNYIPKSFYCPLTMEVMVDPVIDYEGHSYERESIESWLKCHNTSPVTRMPLKPHHLASNVALKYLINEVMGAEWLKEMEVERKNIEHDKKKRRHKGFIEHKCIYRTRLDECLKEINGRTRLAVRLNARGLCAFTYKHLKFVIEVPEGLGSVFFYTCFGKFPQSRTGSKATNNLLMKFLLQLNNIPGPMGLSLDPETNEIVFSFKGHVNDETGMRLQIALEAFIEISLEVQEKVARRFRPDPPLRDGLNGDGSSHYSCLRKPTLPSFLRRSRRGHADRETETTAVPRDHPHRIIPLPRPRSLSRPRSMSRPRSLSRRSRRDH